MDSREQTYGDRSRNAVAWMSSRVVREVAVGSIVAIAATMLAAPAAWAQDDYEAKVANDTYATATSNSEIKSGDIVTGHNSGNSVSTADTHEGAIVIDGGIFVSPTDIDFYIDAGYNDASADAGFNDATVEGPDTDIGSDNIVGDDNFVDESETDITDFN